MINRVCTAYFSGTGKTKKIVETIGDILFDKLSIQTRYNKDFTPKKSRDRELEFNEDDLVIIGLPTIAGRVPNLMLDYLKKIKGNNALCICVMSFGNRNYDDSLMELYHLMMDCSMRVIACGAFVGEHSFSDILAKGRPDQKDIEDISDFANKIYEKIVKSDFSKPSKVGGVYPLRPYYMPQDRNKNPIDIRKVKPKTNDKCIDCKKCANLCPTGAIDFDDVSKVNGICMKCCACIKLCPQKAKYFDDPGYLYHKTELEELYERRAENEYFL